MQFFSSYGQIPSHAYQKVKILFLFLIGCTIDRTLYNTMHAGWHKLRVECFFSFYHKYNLLGPNRIHLTHCNVSCPVYSILSPANRAYSILLLVSYYVIIPSLVINQGYFLIYTVFDLIFDLFYMGFSFSYFKFMTYCVFCMFLVDGLAFGLRSTGDLLLGRYITRVWFVRIDKLVFYFVFLLGIFWIYNGFLFGIIFYLVSKLYPSIRAIHTICNILSKFLLFGLVCARIIFKTVKLYYSCNGKKKIIAKCTISFIILNWIFLICKVSFFSDVSVRVYTKLD